MSSFQMYQKLIHFMYLDKDELKLADEYLERKIFDFDEKFEYYNDLRLFVIKCFNVLKLQKNTRLGLTVCDKHIVDLLVDYKHEFCSCSRVLYETNLREI